MMSMGDGIPGLLTQNMRTGITGAGSLKLKSNIHRLTVPLRSLWAERLSLVYVHHRNNIYLLTNDKHLIRWFYETSIDIVFEGNPFCHGWHSPRFLYLCDPGYK